MLYCFKLEKEFQKYCNGEMTKKSNIVEHSLFVNKFYFCYCFRHKINR